MPKLQPKGVTIKYGRNREISSGNKQRGEIMKTDPEPADISTYLLNFQVFLKERKIMDEDGYVTDMGAFKEVLVTTIEKAIVITDLSTLKEKLKEEQPVLVKIRACIVFSDEVPVRAYFRKYRAKTEPGESLKEYVVQKVDGVVKLTGPQELEPSQQDAMFESLAAEVAAVRIFDEEPAPLAEALRDML